LSAKIPRYSHTAWEQQQATGQDEQRSAFDGYETCDREARDVGQCAHLDDAGELRTFC